MKIKINPDSVAFEELKSKLTSKFPDYQFKQRTKNFLVAKSSGWIGSNIVLRKNNIFVAGNFPEVWQTLIFTILLFGLGILIPIIIYFAAFHGKMRKLEKEIGEYLATQYQASV